MVILAQNIIKLQVIAMPVNFKDKIYTDGQILDIICRSLYDIFTEIHEDHEIEYAQLYEFWKENDTSIRSTVYGLLMEELLPKMRGDQRDEILEEFWKKIAKFTLKCLRDDRIYSRKYSTDVVLTAYSLHVRKKEAKHILNYIQDLSDRIEVIALELNDLKDEIAENRLRIASARKHYS